MGINQDMGWATDRVPSTHRAWVEVDLWAIRRAVEYKPAPTVTPQELIRMREELKISRALFAVYLRTNVRTLENWEQGRAKPNAQAALLINLVKQYPDTVERLAAI